MAAIVRRTWAQIATETQRRAGGISVTGADGIAFSTRVQYFLWASYQDLALKYFHPELFVLDTTTFTLATTTNTLTLSADCFIVIAMSIRNGATYVGEVATYSGGALLGAYTAASGVPTKRFRGANKLYFDKKPDIAYAVDLAYYKRPGAPDFSGSASPETGVDVDEHIIEGALRLINPAVGRPDLGEVNRQLLTEWLADQVHPRFVDEPLEMRERVETNRQLGGAQG